MTLTANQLALTKLYLASFNRAPEYSGLQFWAGEMERGQSFASIVNTVFSLPIVQAIYPDSMSDSDFLAAIYQNVFGKVADAEGLAYWTSQLAGGMDRTSLVMSMVEVGLATADGTPGKAFLVNRLEAAQYAVSQQLAQGTEIAVQTLKEIMAGVTADPLTVVEAAAQVDQPGNMTLNANNLALTKLYLASFKRAPELSGLQFWASEMERGQSFASIVNTVFSLPIVQAIYPDSMSNGEFLTAIYQNVFGKVPDADGLAYWTNQLVGGMDRTSLVMSMVEVGLATPDGTPGKAFLVNRLEAAQEAVLQQLSQGTEISVQSLLEIMTTVTDDPGTVAAAGVLTGELTGTLIVGALVDGYIKDATLFADANGNGVWDPGEAKSISNEKGFFELVGAKGAIIASGGIDIGTNLAFTGTMKAVAGSTVINPLTTLQQTLVEQGLTATQAEALVEAAFAIAGDRVSLQEYDPLAIAFDVNANAADQALAVQVQVTAAKVQNFVVVASNTLVGAAGGSANLSLTDAAKAVVEALVAAIQRQPGVAVDLSQQTLLATILTESVAWAHNSALTAALDTVTALAADFAKIASKAAECMDEAVAVNSTTLMEIGKIVQVEVAAQQEMANRLATAAATGDLSGLVSTLTGTAMDIIVNHSQIGDLDPNSTGDDAVIAEINAGSSGIPISGTLVDGYIKNATVFADSNGNGVWDPGEAKGTSDQNGHFELGDARGALIASGGTDIGTNLNFTGVMKAVAGSTVVNPLTTLQQTLVEQGLTAAQAESQVATAFNLQLGSIDLQHYDPLAVVFSATATEAEKALALQVQTAAAKVENLLVAASNTLVGAAGGASHLTLVDAANAVAASLAEAIHGQAGVGVDLGSQTFLAKVLTDSVVLANNADLSVASGKVSAVAGDFSRMMADAAQNVDEAVANSSTALLALAKIAQVETATQEEMAGQMATAAASGNMSAIVAALTGSAMDTVVNHAVVGDLDPNSTSDAAVIEVVNAGGGVTPPVTPPETPPVTPPETPPVTPPETPPVTPPETPPVTPPVTPPETPPVTPPAETTAPIVASFSSATANGTYTVGATIVLTAVMSEAVGQGSTFDVTLDTGEVVTLTAATNGTTLTGTYLVGLGSVSADLTVSSFGAGRVVDLAGNAMTATSLPFGHNLADSSAIVIVDTSSTLTVAETGGVVSFGGTALGDITVAVTGGVATFTRGGVVASAEVASLATKTVAIAAGETLAVSASNLTDLSGVTITGAGSLKVTEGVSLTQLSGIHFFDFTGTTSYRLADSLANLEVAGGEVAGATSYALTDPAGALVGITVAEQAFAAGAANAGDYTSYSITDSLANLVAAPAVVAAADSYGLTDAPGVLAELTVAAARVQAAASNRLSYTYSLADTLAALLADPAAVAAAASFSLTDDPAVLLANLSVAAAEVLSGATNSGGYSYSLADTLAVLAAAPATVAAADSYSLTDAAGVLAAITVAAHTLLAGASNALAYTYTLADTLATLLADPAALAAATAFTLTDDPALLLADLTIADAEVLAAASNGADYAYSLADTFADLALAPAVVGSASDYSLTDALTIFAGKSVATALSSDELLLLNGAANRGDYTYSLVDTLAALAAAPAVVATADAYTLSNEVGVALVGLTVAEGAFLSGASNGAAYNFSLADTLAALAAGPGVVGAATAYSLTNEVAVPLLDLDVAGSLVVAGAANGASYSYTLADTLVALLGAAHARGEASAYRLTNDPAVTLTDLSVGASAVLAGASNGGAYSYTLADSLAALLAAPAAMAGADGYRLTDLSTAFAGRTVAAALTAEELAGLAGAANRGDYSYSLADTLAALVAAPATVSAADSYRLIDNPGVMLTDLTVAATGVLAAATNRGNYSYSLADTLAALVAAPAAVAGGYYYLVSDDPATFVDLSVATALSAGELAILNGAANRDQITYTLSDTLAAFLGAPATAAGADAYTLTDEVTVLLLDLSVADTAVLAAASNGAGYSYTLADSLAALLTAPLEVAGADAYTLTDDPAVSLAGLTVAAAEVLAAAANGGEYGYSLADSLAAMLAAPAVVAAAAGYSLIDDPAELLADLLVADIAVLAAASNGGDYGYTLADSLVALEAAPAVVAAAAGYSLTDPLDGLVNITVAEFALVAGAENAGDYTSYSIVDSLVNLTGEVGDLSAASSVTAFASATANLVGVALDTDVTVLGLADGVQLTVDTDNLLGITAVVGTDGVGENLILAGAATFDLSGIAFSNLDTIMMSATEAETVMASGGNRIDFGPAGVASVVAYSNADQFGDAIVGFTAGEDKIALSAALTPAATVTMENAGAHDGFALSAGEVVFFSVAGAAGVADNAGSVETFLASYDTTGLQGADLAVGSDAYFLVKDDNGAALYHYVAAAGADAIKAGELTLVTAIDSALVTNSDLALG